MMSLKNMGLLAASLLLVTPALANSTTPPPNTIDLNGSPLINQLPSQVQPLIAPSVQTTVQNQINDYINSQPTPAQLQQIKQNDLNLARMTATPYVEIPRPVVRSMAVNLAPGEQPPLIRLAKGMLTSIVMTDNEGNPWPIEKVVVNSTQVTDHSSVGAEGETNIITLEPLEAITWSNISVTLKNKAIPVMFVLASGQPEVDLRVDARLQGVSPNAKSVAGNYVGEVSSRAITEIDNAALQFLDGTIPSTAERLNSNNPDAQAWTYNNSVYVKTRYDVLYPRYYSKASTGDGVHVYRFDNAISPVGVSRITFTQQKGQPVTISFEKQPNHYYNN